MLRWQVLLVLLASSRLVPHCSGQCKVGMMMTCLMDSLNMLTDGMETLRKIPPNMFYLISVDLVKLPENPSGVFLQRMSEFVVEVQMYVYREQVFQLLPGTSLQALSVYIAHPLREFLIGPKVNLSTLYLSTCALDKIPPTIYNLERLDDLTITRCAIRYFSFDVFANNTRLMLVNLSNNQILKILPSNSKAKHTLTIENVYLAWNKLESIDAATFVALGALRGLDLSYNNLVKVEAQSTVTWPAIEYLNLENNLLKTLNMSWLSAPNLKRFFLNGNGFEVIPTRFRRFPSLQLIGLGNNLFRSIDLAPFNGLPNLNSIDFSYNTMARSIRASRPVRLPMLNSLYAEGCVLTQFNATGLDLPLLSYISLRNNSFSSVPRLVAAFPSLESFSLESNPLSCATLQSYRELIVSGRLIFGVPQKPTYCSGSYITVQESLSLCCDV